ncbi:MAG: DUF1847 domain-containing protein [Gemmatimonadota bacterium]|jgi:uncharacterized metal-binding protein/predicted Fe-Mo cluster-binding NifX family protein
MRFGIPLLADRVAPRCTFADSVLLVETRRRRIRDQARVPLDGTTWADLAAVLTEHGVDTLICGGISRATRESIEGREVEVISNVAGTSEEVLEGLREGRVRPGFGLGGESEEAGHGGRTAVAVPERKEGEGAPADCLECANRVCLRGESCPYLTIPDCALYTREQLDLLESAWDVALEEERSLCRLAELVYVALEMGYKRLGVAFCEDLRQPAEILAGVLRRFFEVEAVSCRVRGPEENGRGVLVPERGCDPGAVAQLLNTRGTELNVLVGFCVGSDCLFEQVSQAPVTTLFVKDKSLANNPIGAVYSHYYLEDI